MKCAKRLLQYLLVLLVVQTIAVSGVYALEVWEPINEPDVSEGVAYHTSLCIGNDGTPYVAFIDGANEFKLSVMKFNGTDWEYVGEKGFTTTRVTKISLCVAKDGTLYVAYVYTGSYLTSVKKFDGTNWVFVGNDGFSVNMVQGATLVIKTYNNRPYVCYDAGAYLTVMKFNGTSWVLVGAEQFTPKQSHAGDIEIYNGTVYCCLYDVDCSGKLSVMYNSGSAWSYLGGAAVSEGISENQVSGQKIFIYGGTIYVAYTDNLKGLLVIKYTGSEWVNVGEPGFGHGYVDSFYIYNGTPYVAYRDTDNSSRATVMKYADSNWSVVGKAGFSESYAYSLSLKFLNSYPVLAYTDGPSSVGKATVVSLLTNPVDDLTGLSLSGSPEGFSFAGDKYSYEDISVKNAVSSVAVTPTGVGTITVNGTKLTSGSASSAIELTADTEKTIAVKVKEPWKISKTYTVKITRDGVYSITYNGNSNDEGTAPSDATIYTKSEEATVLSNSGSLTRSGYTFNGWNTAANGSGTHYAVGASITMTSNLTLYAEWLNTAPTLTSISKLTGATEDTAFTISYDTLASAANAADADSDPISFRVESVSTGTLTKGGTAVTAGTTVLGTGESLVWTPAANASGDLNAFTVKAYDGKDVSASAVQLTVSVAAVNDAPTLTAVAYNPTYTENGPAMLLFGTVACSTVESGQFITAMTLSVSNVANGSDEKLTIDGDSVSLTDETSGKTSANGIDYSVAVTGTSATVSLSKAAGMSAAEGKTLVESIKYSNSSDTPSVSNRVVSITSMTDDGGASDTATLSISCTISIVAVNDAPTISSTDISVKEGVTQAFTAEASDPEKDSITWSISGGADGAKFSVVADTGEVSFKTAPAFGAPTDADSQNDYEVEITASDGALSVSKTITVTVTKQTVYNDASTSTSPAVVEINGKKEEAGTSETKTEGGHTTTTISVDDEKIKERLDGEEDNSTVTLPVNSGADVVVGQLTGQTVKNMENKKAKLEIKTETVTYTLPAAQINIDNVSAQLGQQVELKDIKVNVSIAEPSEEIVKIVKNTAQQNDYQIVVKPIEFEITCTNGDKTISVSKFNGYVERILAIPDSIDPSSVTTGVVINADGTVRHVPTKVKIIDGKYYAVINSLTNSTYTVIWNTVEFADMTSSWAKDAVSDLGSRMIVSGDLNGNYYPDYSITRAEFATMMVRALGLAQGVGTENFTDVKSTDWYYGYIETAAAYGIISGYEDGTFRPNDKITREQAMTIIARAMELTGIETKLSDSGLNALFNKFTDSSYVSNYAKTGVAACIKNEIVIGKAAASIAPTDNVTRAETAVMIQRLLQKSGLI